MPTLEQVRRIWQRLPGSQRLFIGVVLVALVGIIIFVSSWASRDEYGVLYANLAPEDAGEIVDRLNSQGVAYKLTQGGQTVLVPRPEVYELRLSLASAGLPQASGQGYELLDSNKMGWTDFVQKLQFRRALEGEIARTIQTLDAVQQARIHIVMPEPSLFVEEERLPTASVMIKVRAGERLADAEVQGIVRLVAAGVEGLQPAQVTVIDTSGRLLSRSQGQDSLLGVTNDQLELTRTVEEGLARKAESALQEVLGPRRAVVRISAVLDFERAETTREIFDHQNPVVRSEQRNEQTSSESGTTETSTTNYEISKTIEHIVDTPGSITRLSAAVFVDGTYETTPEGGRTYVPRDSEQMQKLTALIKTAIGFDTQRGDELTVENIAFNDTDTQRTVQELEKNERFEMIQKVGGVAVSAVLALGALLVLWRLFSRARAGLAQAGQSSRFELEEDGAGLNKPRDPQAVRIERQLRQMSHQPPEVIASVVRAWLQEP
ncbi:MAG: flagellar M-ring protein FliF [Candidatus Eisenbacteria sp.]|nr:flagellar M-ring protein FliF [Candidatus Eisenbacteria bacterium]